MRYAGSYELEHGFKRSASRMSQKGPGATAFFPDAPSCCASSAWMLYKMLQDTWAAEHPAAQSFRMYGSAPGAPEMRGSLFGRYFAFQYAARAQAFLQLLVSMWLLPAASIERSDGNECVDVVLVGASEVDDARAGVQQVVRSTAVVRAVGAQLCSGQRGGNVGVRRDRECYG